LRIAGWVSVVLVTRVCDEKIREDGEGGNIE